MAYLIVGFALIADSVSSLWYGDRVWRGTIIPGWTGWLGLALGFVLCLIGLRDIRQEKKKPSPHINEEITAPPAITDEEIAKLEAELDAAYLREHGEPPEKPKQPENKQ